MAIVTSNLVKKLRERTGLGILECKNALVKGKGDIESVIVQMRKLGIIKAAKKANQKTAEGIVSAKILAGAGVLVEINCQTDFVAKDPSFKQFCDAVAEKASQESHTINIVSLKRHFESERVNLVSKTGENIRINRLHILEGNNLSMYVHHSKKIGVLVDVKEESPTTLGKNIAMHIAANNPEYIKQENIPKEILEKERVLQLEVAKKSGKNMNISEKIAAGRVKKFIDNICLVNQNFVLDANKTVAQTLSNYSAEIIKFIRFELGECANNQVNNI